MNNIQIFLTILLYLQILFCIYFRLNLYIKRIIAFKVLRKNGWQNWTNKELYQASDFNRTFNLYDILFNFDKLINVLKVNNVSYLRDYHYNFNKQLIDKVIKNKFRNFTAEYCASTILLFINGIIMILLLIFIHKAGGANVCGC